MKWNIILLLFLISACNRKNTTATEQKELNTTMIDSSNTTSTRGDIRIVTYNVENLFDTKDDTLKDDEEFLPNGLKAWNNYKYNTKLKVLYKVMCNIGGDKMPDIFCLTEIENKTVLEDLIERTPFNEFDYGIIHEESPDARGVDVGFLYRRSSFIPIYHDIIRIDFPNEPTSKTRDVLVIAGVLNKKDTIHLFICHFPSRRGGETASEYRRNFVADKIRQKIDSLFSININSNIIVTGDFNDEPTNTSIYDVLKAKEIWDNKNPTELYNFMYDMKVNKGLGTYKFQGYWNMLDHFMVSKHLLDPQNNIFLLPNSAAIYSPSWLEQPDEEAPGTKPYRTYSGPNYQGGYSDHFPIYLDVYFK